MKLAVIASVLVASVSTVAAVPVSPLWEHGPPFAHPYRAGETPSTAAPGTLLPTAAADEGPQPATWAGLLDRVRWGKAAAGWRPVRPTPGKQGHGRYRGDHEADMYDSGSHGAHGTHADLHHIHYHPQDLEDDLDNALGWSVQSEVWVGASEPASSFVARVWASVSEALEQPSVYASVMFLVAAMNLATIILAVKYLDRSRRSLADDESSPAGPCACQLSRDEKKP